jgi:uncharacterized protein YecT (DUF1311 family)
MRVLLALALLIASLPLFGQTPGQRQRAAHAALQSELSAQGKDCPNTNTTREASECLGNVLEHTRANFNIFYESLSALLDPENRKFLNDAQTRWGLYRETSCDAICRFYRGGTIQPSEFIRCEIELTRSRMRDLDSIYNTVLHL